VPDDLPFVDEFEVLIEASAGEVFLCAAARIGRSLEGQGARVFARLLGCAHRGASYTVPPVEGQETNGFRVAEVKHPKKLVMEGEHRFARYRLSFLIEPLAEKRALLRARTEAAFPGVVGAAYRALVIGSGGHEVVVHRMLASIAKRAEGSR
jgi:hypothetical protein